MAFRDRPYSYDHDASVSRKANERREMPNFQGLLHWFARGFTAEVPTDIHTVGVEVERPGTIVRSDGEKTEDGGGGSQLGSPRLNGGFRAHVFGSAFRTEHPSSDYTPEIGESYATPMRATITWMERNRHPVWAMWLRRLGYSGGDWQTVTTSAGWDIEVGEAVTRTALSYAWLHFREEPTARPVKDDPAA